MFRVVSLFCWVFFLLGWVDGCVLFVCLFVSIGNFTSLAILNNFQTNMTVKFGLSRRKYFVPQFHEVFCIIFPATVSSWFFYDTRLCLEEERPM